MGTIQALTAIESTKVSRFSLYSNNIKSNNPGIRKTNKNDKIRLNINNII